MTEPENHPHAGSHPDPDTLVDLTSAASEFEASVMVESLKSEGVPAFTFSNAGMTLQWEIAATMPFRVCVRSEDVEKARKILRSAREESVDIDWSEVDVGENTDAKPPAARKTPIPEWFAKSGTIVLILAVLVFFLLNALSKRSP